MRRMRTRSTSVHLFSSIETLVSYINHCYDEWGRLDQLNCSFLRRHHLHPVDNSIHKALSFPSNRSPQELLKRANISVTVEPSTEEALTSMLQVIRITKRLTQT